MPHPEGFLNHVTAWARDPARGGRHLGYTVDVDEVTDVTSFGTDWAGDTEGGFRSTFEVTVTYVTATGDKRMSDIDGEALADLWNWVVNAWPGS